ncbi:MAG: DUF3662 and FHA domain-containing protein [Propionibacteriaceae bacterium]|nr:DUF3662 and FHA domain-containing protein [Propionibacteriaceae bacterium]
MGLFDRAEKKIESAVSGVFARAFKGDVQPVEITAQLQRELDAEAKLLSRDKRLVPNDFVVHLSEHDYNRLAPYSKTLNSEIVAELRGYAADRGYVFNGPVSIHYELDPDLPTGKLSVRSSAVAGVDAPDTPGQLRRGRLVLEVNGVRHPLAGSLVIGRGSTADLRINDPGISREHARITVVGSPENPAITIEDMGSTNGVRVNGVRTTYAALTEGSRIEIGSTRMLVHAPLGDT